MNKDFLVNKIKSIIGKEREVISFAHIKLYTSNKESKSWFYSDLTGIICFILDFTHKVRFITLYDHITLEVLFKFQLYFEFDNYYQILSENFHCFEVDSGFIGLEFFNKHEAKVFSLNLNRFDDRFTILYLKEGQKEATTLSEMQQYTYPFSQKCLEIKRKIIMKLHFNHKHDVVLDKEINISFLKSYDLLRGFVYEKEKREFAVSNISSESKDFFRKIGIRKADLRNTHLALVFFKQILTTMKDTFEGKMKRSHRNVHQRNKSQQSPDRNISERTNGNTNNESNESNGVNTKAVEEMKENTIGKTGR